MAANFGTFEKNGEVREAADAAEAVGLRWNGWAEKSADAKSAAKPAAAKS